jgi:hemolysin III
MKRTRLSARILPTYSRGEETMNAVTHIVGGGIGILALIGCLGKALISDSTVGITAALVYCLSMILVYTVSSVYHGLKPGMGKKVMQVLDHCAIYLLIAGTYTPITMVAIAPVHPFLGWGMTVFQWSMAALAITLTAIDLKKYNVFSMICYICTGWAILPFMIQTQEALTQPGFLFLLFGGIAYTVGAVLYGIGSRCKWFHSIFHIFVVLGSFLQLISIVFYVF